MVSGKYVINTKKSTLNIKNFVEKFITTTRIKVYLQQLIARQSMIQLLAESDKNPMKRSLGVWQLIALGVGGIIGTGIFVLSGKSAALFAGPSIIISFIIAGIVAGLAALSYSEMASMVPLSGSAYTYCYATMGEFLAWIMGWYVTLGNLAAIATVSVGWSAYIVNLIQVIFPFNATRSFILSPIKWNETSQEFISTHAYINIPAIVIIVVLTILVFFGIQESSKVNFVVVIIKIFVILLVIFASLKFIAPNNYHPFIPKNEGHFNSYGVTGMLHAATIVFFAYIGFDAVTNVAQETKNPKRDLPIGILVSLLISTVLYIGVCIVMIGVVPYKRLDSSSPMDVVLKATHLGKWIIIIVDIGAISALTSVILVNLICQPRIFYSMANDGLLPQFMAKIHPRFKTPWIAALITGVICAPAAGFLPLEMLGELTSIANLFTLFLVHISVIIMRFTQKDVERRFKVPLGPFVIPLIGALLCLLLMITSATQTWIRFWVWMGLGILIYFCYGIRNSKFNHKKVKDSSVTIATDVTPPYADGLSVHEEEEKKHDYFI
ncbi:unnamed protein product [Didymodactylos carnosus]|uniref:Amino acid permease n=1 Tax=Didymodactylos carnosus TaxID=1234261 RepID=A0A814IZW5_9BILA|nr:unnamed protein product [Didymodactylos carnosus]CAF1032718.1 unnamed protein product [Didymodactylos carnosus]CAF3760728.1 unnamed protein product [Didymodactylos carnosus]CAF3803510.1 unnamed protein product [Didymodactylos carnosus]